MTAAGSGTADHLLAIAARTLLEEGFAVAGVIQENEERAAEPPDMFLHVLTAGVQIRISQDLGTGSKGCRLDTQGLEEAAGLFAQVIDGPVSQRPRLLIINKFGKQEAEGRGFTPVIGQALANGIPVLTSVGRANLESFLRFAGDLAEAVDASPDGILGWARTAAAPAEA